ncbi:hypothetical protein GCM10009557_83850 [Virgisporangium ochraceum]
MERRGVGRAYVVGAHVVGQDLVGADVERQLLDLTASGAETAGRGRGRRLAVVAPGPGWVQRRLAVLAPGWVEPPNRGFCFGGTANSAFEDLGRSP